MNLFEPTHLIIVLLIVLVLFGGKKIPELMRGVGRGVGELQKGLHETKQQLNASLAEDAEVKSTDHVVH